MAAKKKPGPPKGTRYGGRQKGTPNKVPSMLKDAIIEAARKAGTNIDPKTKDGVVTYLSTQAMNNPTAFMPLLGKVLPMQISGVDDEPIKVTTIEIVAPDVTK